MTRCPYNDCGWCYAPVNVEKNDKQGQCLKPMECPYLKWLSNRKSQ